ncbi:hypothetical protein [Micromonospora sp. WMMD998]|uniref:hypothetical protein n=1 Tax=Micromonospora sp. WMMD998 TaxID=3016092 RepID=UPI00249C1656|nr:hypothetical protein [Micromonospora sp. WMMD998]WFE40261.1 hypothetical protein O7619_18170 [Micromonospora sp. WMMD998]
MSPHVLQAMIRTSAQAVMSAEADTIYGAGYGPEKLGIRQLSKSQVSELAVPRAPTASPRCGRRVSETASRQNPFRQIEEAR